MIHPLLKNLPLQILLITLYVPINSLFVDAQSALATFCCMSTACCAVNGTACWSNEELPATRREVVGCWSNEGPPAAARCSVLTDAATALCCFRNVCCNCCHSFKILHSVESCSALYSRQQVSKNQQVYNLNGNNNWQMHFKNSADPVSRKKIYKHFILNLRLPSVV